MSNTAPSVKSDLPRWAIRLIQNGISVDDQEVGEINFQARQAVYRVFCSASRRGIDCETIITYLQSQGHQHRLWDQLTTRYRKGGRRTYRVTLPSILTTLRKIWRQAQDFLKSTFQGDFNCDGQEVLGWAQQWQTILATNKNAPGVTPLQSRVLEYVALQHLKRGYSTVTAPCSEVAEYCGVTKRAAWKALRALTEEGLLVKISAGSPILVEHNAAIFQITSPSTYVGEVNNRPSLQVKSTKDPQKETSTPITSLVGTGQEPIGVLKPLSVRRHRPIRRKENDLRTRVLELMRRADLK